MGIEKYIEKMKNGEIDKIKETRPKSSIEKYIESKDTDNLKTIKPQRMRKDKSWRTQITDETEN